MVKWVWYEQYDRCGCSTVERKRRDLLGYCKVHGTDRQRGYPKKLPGEEFRDDADFGHAGG